jgi:ribosome-binding factor A
VSTRLSRVEQTLRREIAGALVRGDLRDPRLEHIAAISITAVKVAADLGSARVFVDVAGDGRSVRKVVSALNAGSKALRAIVGAKLRMKRTPTLRFEADESIEKGRRIEAVLAELQAERKGEGAAAEHEGDDDPEDA